jgi:hypothetical protein
MHKLKRLKELLVDAIECEVEEGLEGVDTKELGEAIDMVKDLAKAMYYCTITEAMEGEGKKDAHDGHSTKSLAAESHMDGGDKSAHSKRRYMEGKMHNDKAVQMKELEVFAQELTWEIMEMMREASPEEKALLQ